METGEGLLLRWTAGGVGREAESLDALLACPRYWGVSSRGHAVDVGSDVLHGRVRCATGLGGGGRRRHAAVHGGGWYGLHAVHTGVHHVAAKLLSHLGSGHGDHLGDAHGRGGGMVGVDDGHDAESASFVGIKSGELLALALLAGVLDTLVQADGAAAALLAD